MGVAALTRSPSRWAEVRRSGAGRTNPAVRRSKLRTSRQQCAHDLAVDVGQPEAAALVQVGQAFVIDAEQVQQRGVEIVDVHGMLGDVVGEVVGRAVDETPALTPPPAIHIVKQRG